MVSIADVAARAQVSTTTVSHALSGKRSVRPEMQERVRAAMAELGYVPRRSAQNLASGRTRLIGLIVPDIANDYFAELAKGAEEAAIQSEYNVVLCNSGFDHAREVLYLETIQSRAVDGVLYAAGAPPTGSELGAVLGDLPAVLVDEDVPGAERTAFVSDNESGGRLAAQHLLGLGHKQAGVLAAPDLASSEARSRGFASTWTEMGNELPVIVHGPFTFEGGRAAAEGLIASVLAGSITAVFAANDLMALGAIRLFEEHGLKVPDDVSVVGFDNSAAARYAGPALTTVHQDVHELGSRAMSTLISALETRQDLEPARHVLPVRIVVRDSTARPPSRTSSNGSREEKPRS